MKQVQSQEKMDKVDGGNEIPQSPFRQFVGQQTGTTVLTPLLKFLHTRPQSLAAEFGDLGQFNFKTLSSKNNPVKINAICAFIERTCPTDDSAIACFKKICGLADPIIVHADNLAATPSSLSSKAVFDNAPSGLDARRFLFDLEWKPEFDKMISGKWGLEE